MEGQDGQQGTDVAGAGADGTGTEPGSGLPAYGEAGSGTGDDGIAYGTEDDPFGNLEGIIGGGGDAEGEGTEQGAAGGGSAGQGGQSTQARVQVLDERLDESFGEFDGMILGERERIEGARRDDESVAAAQPGYGGGTGGDAGDSEGQGTVLARNGGASGGTSSGGSYMPGGSDSTREGDFDHSGEPRYPIPDDIPSGNNDDVVARQLREAAMAEPDPELREKLWDEYRNYTGLSN